MPEFRKEGIKHAEQECHSRRKRHKSIHVCLSKSRLLPRVDEKTSSKVKDDRSRKNHGKITCISPVHKEHPHNYYGYRKYRRPKCSRLDFAKMFLLRFFLNFFRVLDIYNQVIADRLYGLLKIGRFYGFLVVFDPGRLVGEINGRVVNPRSSF